MTDRAPTPADARDLLAAEYVLGLTEPADLPRVETLIMRDSSFAAAVANWRGRLAPLDLTIAPIEAPASLWAGVEAALAELEIKTTEQTHHAPAESATPAPEPAPAPPAPAAPVIAPPVAPALPTIEPRMPAPPPRPMRVETRESFFARWWASLAFWRFAGLAGSFAAIALAVGLAYTYRQAMRQPVLIAVLMSPDGNQPTAIVHAFSDGRADMTPLVQFDIPAGKVVEIWTLWDKALGPRSVGLLDRTGRMTLKLEGLPTPKPGQVFEMTLESAGGSPTGKPTGPVLNKGEATTAL
ncbi:anti-sigma factor [Terrarubrum flagellatum]|uniref:anti-sigma factor n=1 Tax=Terrirubrum flagellatum TaxID=2895980 RepID=UPI003144F988